jgi:prolyl 4-hydroxylase
MGDGPRGRKGVRRGLGGVIGFAARKTPGGPACRPVRADSDGPVGLATKRIRAMLTQQITPEILRWISAQAGAGHTAEAVLEAMRRSGWSPDVATRAIEESKRGSPDHMPDPIAAPSPRLEGKPSVVRTSDRVVQVLTTMTLPRVIVFGGLLSPGECDELVETARARLERSRTVDNWSGSSEVSHQRTSDGAYFERGQTALLRRVEARIAELLDWPVDAGEGLQVLRYGPGAEYQPHHDFFDPTIPGNARMLRFGGQRVATLVTYIGSPARGGVTTFPDVGLEVAPIKGNAVFFSYGLAHRASLTLHGSEPVLEGEKWVATKWLRARAFDMDAAAQA